jgi:hypothetical protein
MMLRAVGYVLIASGFVAALLGTVLYWKMMWQVRAQVSREQWKGMHAFGLGADMPMLHRLHEEHRRIFPNSPINRWFAVSIVTFGPLFAAGLACVLFSN